MSAEPTDFLQQMAAGSRQRAELAKRRLPQSELQTRISGLPPVAGLRPCAARFDLIAELKLRSPAVGQLKSGSEDVVARVNSYARAGAAAVSVLTEPTRFDGSMQHLELAARSLAPLAVPAMRKDFLVDPYQIMEAQLAGAGGVLVIVRMLSPAVIDEMLDCARQLGMFVLLEAFDETDIEAMHGIIDRAAPAPKPAVPYLLAGLNCRDLATLQIVPARLLELAHLLPSNVPRVAESGVSSPQDAAQVAAAGYSYALVGSALMQGDDPQSLVAAMLTAGRSARTA